MNSELHQKIVEAWKDQQTDALEICIMVSEIVGQYNKGQLAGLASDMSLSVQQVYSRGQAGATYRELSSVCGEDHLDWIYEKLTWSHLAAAGNLMRRYEIDPRDMISHLDDASQEGTSVMMFRKIVSDIHGESESNEWEKRVIKVGKQIGSLINDYGLPEPLRVAAKEFQDVLKLYTENKDD